MVGQTHNQLNPSSRQSHWLILIIIIILLGIALITSQCSHTKNSFTQSAKTITAQIACSSNGYTAVYYPFKGSPYQEIILENASGEDSSLDKFMHTQIKYGNQALADIQGLTCLESLDIFDIGKKNITDLTPLAKLKHLKHLSMGGTQVTDLTPVSHLTELTELGIYDSPISQLPSLTSLTNLKWLTVCDTTTSGSISASPNTLTDITPIRDLSNLTDLTLCFDQPVDLTPLYNLKKLQEVSFYGAWPNLAFNAIQVNPLPKHYPQQIVELKQALPQTKILFGESSSPLIIPYQ